ncbi:MAG: LysE family transporter [Candidatus Babeliales bacterium]|nr:LysE family transporter [Candidatus Babeliales bacterium]
MTELLKLFLDGFILGLAVAAPIGPVGVLCIKKTLSSGLGVGLSSGFGASIAKVCYGIVVGFGLTSVSNFLINYNTYISIIGAAFLTYLGIKIFMTKPDMNCNEAQKENKVTAFITMFMLTIMNPMTVLSFLAVFSGLGIANTAASYSNGCTLIAGIFSGSMSWWIFLCTIVNLFRQKINSNVLSWINKISGVVIVSFAVIIILNVVR